MKKTRILKIIIILFIAFCLIGWRIYANSNLYTSDNDTKIISGYYDCNENGFAVPGDALYYSEYYYDTDVLEKISKSYNLVTAENKSEVEFYLKVFKEKYMYDTFTGNKDFLNRIDEGDFYNIESGCSNEVNKGHFLLYFFDQDSKTVYYMFRCQ
ncbi:MAG: hypothetical protein UHM85_05285 [Acutalibacteraceae bacterium]|nr:hypothetical protein [Acutalibacteraceae bacterium]